MKYLHFVTLLFILFGCSSGNSGDPENTIQINASGLNQPVTLFESFSKLPHEIPRDGTFQLALPTNQTIYNLEIVNSGPQFCRLTPQLDLICELSACLTVFEPVCAKKPFAGVVCITAPCPTDRYQTYANQCETIPDNAAIAFHSECEALEGQLALHQEPVYLGDIALMETYSDAFQITTSNIVEDTLTINFSITGGCGSHDFSLIANDVFFESQPVQLLNIAVHTANDSCTDAIVIEKEFDLLPIKEIYRRAYPDATGNQSVLLIDLGIYTFTLD